MIVRRNQKHPVLLGESKKARLNRILRESYAGATPEAKAARSIERKARHAAVTPEAKAARSIKRNAQYAAMSPEKKAAQAREREAKRDPEAANAKRRAAYALKARQCKRKANQEEGTQGHGGISSDSNTLEGMAAKILKYPVIPGESKRAKATRLEREARQRNRNAANEKVRAAYAATSPEVKETRALARRARYAAATPEKKMARVAKRRLRVRPSRAQKKTPNISAELRLIRNAKDRAREAA